MVLKVVSAIKQVLGAPQSGPAKAIHKDIKAEAKLGGKLFGPVPAGTVREFFCLDDKTWVWHEEWLDGGVRKMQTVHYNVGPEIILKRVNGGDQQSLSPQEVDNLLRAAELYRQYVVPAVYR